MAYYYGTQHHQNVNNTHSSHNHHGGRSRRAPRLSSQNSHRQFRGVRSMKELTDVPIVSAFRTRFEACKGFDIDDDLEFCPNLLTEDDVSWQPSSPRRVSTDSWNANTFDSQLQSIHSSSSDRSSLSSGSPSGSPLQHQVQPTQQVTPHFSLSQSYHPSSYNHTSNSQMKIHQPAALRTRNAIPIVNPSTGMRVASPPQSISPARMQQQTYARRGW